MTARRGRILLTVPCGERPDADWYVAKTADEWLSLFRDAKLYVSDTEEYVLLPEGWRSGRGDGPAVLCAELHPGRLRHRILRRLRRG